MQNDDASPAIIGVEENGAERDTVHDTGDQDTSSQENDNEENDNEDGYRAVRNAYPPILNSAQVAELLDLNPRTVLNMAGDGRLPASRLPGSRKFHFLLEDIISTLKAHRIAAPDDRPTADP